MNNKAFVFSGMALLLVLPVLIMAASFTDVVKTGNMGVSLNLRADRVFQVKTDLEETVVSASISSGRYNAHQATLNLSLTFEELTQESGLEYASLHSFYTDPEVSASDSKTVIEENIRNSINNALGEVIADYSSSGVNIIINQGNNVTGPDISINQTEPFTFIVGIDSMPLYIDFGFTTYNGTLNSVTAVVPIEGLMDPYIFVKTKGRSTNRIFESPYGNNISSFLYNDTVGSGSSLNPRPYYHNNTEGLSFFCKLDGKTSAACTDIDASKMETFVLGDPLSQTSASVVDHQYFENVLANGTATYNPPTDVPSASPNSYVFQLDCGHELYYSLGSCTTTTTASTSTSTTTTTTTTSSTTTTIGGGSFQYSQTCDTATYISGYWWDRNTYYDDDGFLIVRKRWGRPRRVLILCNMSSIPNTANVTVANLTLYNGAGDNGQTVKIWRVTKSWDELYVTWNTYDGVNFWTTAGGDFAVSAQGSGTTAPTTVIAFTADEVTRFIDETYPNNGWIIKFDNDNSWGSIRNYAWDDETGTAPLLQIAYTN
ncbi:MAG TPA: DNRLRE domain-containing protein [Euryarchaeota archaeon]|nr:DNRLRE domain-containing protein [Euryarchaeota archaeon]